MRKQALADEVLSSFIYKYDLSGNIIEEDAVNGDDRQITRYTYNSRNELVKSEANHCKFITTTNYAYDKAGNRIAMREVKGTKTTQSAVYSFDSADRMLKVDNYYDWEHHVMTWQYDKNGNMVRKDTMNNSYTTYAYDDENRLVAIRDNIQLLIAALYDGNGDRIFTVQPKWDESGWHDNWNNGEWTTNGMWDGDWEGWDDGKWHGDSTSSNPSDSSSASSSSSNSGTGGGSGHGDWKPEPGGNGEFDGDGCWRPMQPGSSSSSSSSSSNPSDSSSASSSSSNSGTDSRPGHGNWHPEPGGNGEWDDDGCWRPMQPTNPDSSSSSSGSSFSSSSSSSDTESSSSTPSSSIPDSSNSSSSSSSSNSSSSKPSKPSKPSSSSYDDGSWTPDKYPGGMGQWNPSSTTTWSVQSEPTPQEMQAMFGDFCAKFGLDIKNPEVYGFFLVNYAVYGRGLQNITNPAEFMFLFTGLKKMQTYVQANSPASSGPQPIVSSSVSSEASSKAGTSESASVSTKKNASYKTAPVSDKENTESFSEVRSNVTKETAKYETGVSSKQGRSNDAEHTDVTENYKGHMVDYNHDVVRDTMLIPNNINQWGEENYELTGYINDVNTEYTQVLMEYSKSGTVNNTH